MVGVKNFFLLGWVRNVFAWDIDNIAKTINFDAYFVKIGAFIQKLQSKIAEKSTIFRSDHNQELIYQAKPYSKNPKKLFSSYSSP